ncbi:threonylcarbamoyladenosine tRNA methylthiotransferase MtaB [Aureimonas pseudogalii]|uniref:Threonylcarbamoyladenosine tRNA methylthiotransferase MtaB n=2 Tax=Aureimonas pseudogalii TaxID=1744844 RepID=A0A7W6H7E1_9HYPH|nr:threonylcarbamoyladenosine tRNA methylthiotransferase MtaB [Aureimonas pseudogalii]
MTADPAPTLEIVSFGCRLNTYEAEVMRREAGAAGLGSDGRRTVLVNTCAVTAEAVRQARQAVRRARRDDPGARILVTGCAAQTEGPSFAAMPEVDAVIGNDDKLHARAYRDLPTWSVEPHEKLRVNDIMSVRETAGHMVDAIEGRARAIVQVQTGCDHRCTFCIIPFGRGNSRSVPAGPVVDQVRRLVDLGYREVVLSGVDLTSWGHDLPGAPRLGALVQSILRLVPALERLRLSSIDSVEVDGALMEAIAGERRVMPHLHLSLQAGDDLILKRMKRRHTRVDAVRIAAAIRARRPDIVFGADLIAGFPTETDAMAENTLALIEDCGLTHLHVFPFSPREGTPAARMPQVPVSVAKARAATLRERGERALDRHRRRLAGTRQRLLVERGGRARTEDFTLAAIGFGLPGEIVDAILHLDGAGALQARPLSATPSGAA